MIHSNLLKSSFTSILITLLMTLQMSACNASGNPDIQDNPTLNDVNLSWVTPAEREDNTAISLSEITGYKVYYGTIQNDYHNSVTINDGSAAGHTIKGLSTGTYYFTLTTYDTEGRESQLSPVVKIVV